MNTPAGQTSALPIVFAADGNFSVPLAIAVESLLRSARPETKYDIHVLDDGVLDFAKHHIDALHGRYTFAITYHSVADLVQDMPVTHYFHRVTYARFLIARLLKDHKCPRVFYSDADVLFCGDISDVYDTDMQGHALAGVQELGCLQARRSANMRCSDICYLQTWARNFCINKDEPGGAYFNAGNFLLDCARFEERHYGEKATELCRKITIERAPFLDQDVLNAVCWRDIALLPLKYCVIPINEEYYACEDYDAMYRGLCLYSREELRKVLSESVVLHFAGQKPRVLEGARYPLEQRFIDFWAKSAWRDYMPYSPRIGSMSPSRFIKLNVPISSQLGVLRKELLKYTVVSCLPLPKRRHYAGQRAGLRRVLQNARPC